MLLRPDEEEDEELDELPAGMVRPTRTKRRPGAHAETELHVRLRFDAVAVIECLRSQCELQAVVQAVPPGSARLQLQHQMLLQELRMLITQMGGTIKKGLPPTSEAAWRKQIVALLTQRGGGLFLQAEAERMIGHVEDLCKYLLE